MTDNLHKFRPLWHVLKTKSTTLKMRIKRGQEMSDEEIKRKIRKLQDRLNRDFIEKSTQKDCKDSPQDQQSGCLRFPQQRDEVLYYEYTDCDTPQEPSAKSASPNSSHHTKAPPSPPPAPPPPPPASPPPSPMPRSPPPAPKLAPPAQPLPPPAPEVLTAPLPSAATTCPVEAEPRDPEVDLEDDILELLGDAPKTDTTLGPQIHRDVASRWQKILAKGLPKDIKDSLIKAYKVPSNCDLLIAPKLNPEVKAALPELLVKRDASLFYKQKQLSAALAALASAMDLIVSNETTKLKILKPVSDACRILCDSHSSETKTRRRFIITGLNSKLKDILQETKRNSMLFGDNITEKIKAAKTIQQSSDALKPQQKPKMPTEHPNNKKKGNLNFVGQHRKVENKSQNGAKSL